jgi:hypothetical protein
MPERVAAPVLVAKTYAAVAIPSRRLLRELRIEEANHFALGARVRAMEYLVGLVLAAAVAAFAAGLGLVRDRSFGLTVLIVVATYYVLFAVMGGSRRALVVESVFVAGFLLLGVLGLKKIPWLIAAAIAGHGVFDVFHHSLVDNPGVPAWWPGFCMAFDVAFGLWMGWDLTRRSHRDSATKSKSQRS